jgi:HlyD family secretion protein
MAGNKFRLKWVVLTLVVLAVAVLGWWYIKRHNDGATTYQTAAVTRDDLIQFVTATGQLNPVTNVQVGSQVSGRIKTLLVDYNSAVTAGQVIAEIDPASYQANVHQGEGDVANSKAALELARINEAREKQLLAAKLVPPSDYDQMVATLHQAEATVQIKEAVLENSRVNLEYCTIYSPVDGTIISRNVDVGQTVAASLSAPTLYVIANDLTKMQIDANVAEADIGTVEPGQDVDFTVDAFPYRTFHGTVVQVRNSPLTVQNVVTYDTVIGVNNKELKLRPGMTANVSIIVARSDNALKIPNSALRFRLPDAPIVKKEPPSSVGAPGGQKRGTHKQGERQFSRSVYVLSPGSTKPQPVQIKVGISDGTSTEVVEGLKEGDPVVISALAEQAGAAQSANPFTGGRRF